MFSLSCLSTGGPIPSTLFGCPIFKVSPTAAGTPSSRHNYFRPTMHYHSELEILTSTPVFSKSVPYIHWSRKYPVASSPIATDFTAHAIDVDIYRAAGEIESGLIGADRDCVDPDITCTDLYLPGPADSWLHHHIMSTSSSMSPVPSSGRIKHSGTMRRPRCVSN